MLAELKKFPTQQANEKIVSLLEAFLEQAKEGHVKAIAIVAVDSEFGRVMHWEGIPAVGHASDALYTGITILAHRLCDYLWSAQAGKERT